jgi:hypothetical protein
MKKSIYILLAILAAVLLVNHLYPLDNYAQKIQEGGPSFYPDAVKKAVLGKLRDPDSARFADMDVYDDRTWKGRRVTVTCGSINAKNGFGGYAGPANFIFVEQIDSAFVDPGLNNGQFVGIWNTLCAGEHKKGTHISGMPW